MKIIPISGKDSLVTALVQSNIKPSNYHFIFNDTNCELPETYEWLNKIERIAKWKITRIGKDLKQIIKDQKILPSHKVRFCTYQAKIKPLEQWLGAGDHEVYWGLRADENRIGYQSRSKLCRIKSFYPLQENNIDLGIVYAILNAKNLLPPSFHWQALEDKVNELMSSQPYIYGDWKKYLSNWERRILFSGRSRSNCYFCFFQRMYEFCWLYDAHPELFESAVRMEETTGGEGFTWVKEKSLREIIKDRDRYIETRAKEICHYIDRRIYQQVTKISTDTEIALTSCGMFCGK
jgi:3'-phosphoadenosine 5'-phosphosulfate sulfotransferase (PAPS reductase)/FAD synthetase